MPPVVGRIGVATLERLARRGYAQTTIADIASGAGVPEDQLHAQFASVDILVAAMTAPLLQRLDAQVRAAKATDTSDHVEVAAILGDYLDTLVDFRSLIEVLLGDPTAAVCPAVERVRARLTGLRDQLAGPLGGLDGRIRASAALGAVQQAVADFADADFADADFADAELSTTRAAIIDTAVAILVSNRR